MARLAPVSVSPIEGDSSRLLMQPGSRNRRGLQGLKCNGANDLIEMGGKQCVENLTSTRIMDCRCLQPRLEQG